MCHGGAERRAREERTFAHHRTGAQRGDVVAHDGDFQFAIGQDEEKRQADQVQKATDQAIADIDGVLAAKEKEIMQV